MLPFLVPIDRGPHDAADAEGGVYLTAALRETGNTSVPTVLLNGWQRSAKAGRASGAGYAAQ